MHRFQFGALRIFSQFLTLVILIKFRGFRALSRNHVLVETKWTDAGALAAYEENRQTLLDLLLPSMPVAINKAGFEKTDSPTGLDIDNIKESESTRDRFRQMFRDGRLADKDVARAERMRAELEEWQKSVVRSLNGKDY